MVVGVSLIVQLAGGDFQGKRGMALPEQETGESTKKFRTLPPDVTELRGPAEGEQVEHLSVLV